MTKYILLKNRLACILSIVFVLLHYSPSLAQPTKHRLVVMADMGNEPDEVQQMTHLMLYANEFDLEGLIAVTGKYLNPQSHEPYKRELHPELFHEIIDGYELDLENLKKHASGWPEAEYLHSIVTIGQTGYGIEATGIGKSSEGSKRLIQLLTNGDERPLYTVVNAGSNTLAQAIIDYEVGHTKEELDLFISKIRVFENGAQDNAGAWICSKYPNIHWLRSNYQTYCYGGPSSRGEKNMLNSGPHAWKPFEYSYKGQHHWALEHVMGNHGSLGRRYPLRRMKRGYIAFIEGGGTIPWLGLIHQGLSDFNHPEWGGWSGRFSKEKQKNVWSRHDDIKKDEENYNDFYLFTEVADSWYYSEEDILYNNIYAPVWRWRQDYFNDFQCRMDWCQSDFSDANHNPVVAINGDTDEKIHFIKCVEGEDIHLNAIGTTDPDGDSLSYNWWIYPEAGSFKRELELISPNQPQSILKIPAQAKGQTIHVVLTVRDHNPIASLCDYRRIVIEVQ